MLVIQKGRMKVKMTTWVKDTREEISQDTQCVRGLTGQQVTITDVPSL